LSSGPKIKIWVLVVAVVRLVVILNFALDDELPWQLREGNKVVAVENETTLFTTEVIGTNREFDPGIVIVRTSSFVSEEQRSRAQRFDWCRCRAGQDGRDA